MTAPADGADRGLVVITGANGIIGYACVVYAVQVGYRVRCVVRRSSAIETIKSAPSVQSYLHCIDYTIVPDNTIEGAYDEALEDAQYVVHIAGAWPMPHLHPDNDIYYPFIESTKNLVKAAEKAGTIKRVVFTQAGAGLVDSEDGDTLGTCMDQQVEVSKTSLEYKPPLKSPHNAYTAAKAQCMDYLAHTQVTGQLGFSIVQIIPGTVIGPSEFCDTAEEALAHMDRQTKALLFDDVPPRYAFGFVHVQDCAKIHIEALDEEKVKSEDLPKWFVAAGTVEEGIDATQLWNAAADMIEKEFGDEVNTGLFKVGRTKVPINAPFRADSQLTEELLLGGGRIRGLEESVREVARWYVGLKGNEI
ncbi:NAD-binding-10 multi-domain protein [Pyrenophora tritici-repentis]|nr:NAD-binding-10 multi-domain protein [Pyrenophora tritici-repentis]KAI0607063.1 NAD-binding-10 multi-domain protein [Pyrenophora tritici-repentis]KAI1529158.1 NAD-binding-10 multi-domain protein [Pyrenophora tritici-repentis]KAI1566849.1 NAD-binding-10 multi-domain protein [Pyrenophora tritici-repentis]KAI1582828.1 NAD-binding-10 multi-domain protein [Pyrenophora tritici-repentis]